VSNPLDLLLRTPSRPQASYHWGTVTGTAPLRVKIDGDSESLPITPKALCPCTVGDRVYCQIRRRRLLILGASKAGDSGWGDLALTDSNFEAYAPSTRPAYRVRNGVVWIRGDLRLLTDGYVDTASLGPKFAELPPGLEPTHSDEVVLCQGSNRNHWCLRINGRELHAARYGPEGSKAGNWLPFNHSWPI
jgi:hypothetical protein